MIDRFRRNFSDFVDLFLIPICISLLPASVGFRVLRFWVRHDRSHESAVNDAWESAHRNGVAGEEREWRRKFKLLRLQERVDVWLVLTRSATWWSRRVIQTGEFPESGPCILLTYHWGCAHWIWSTLNRQGISSHFVARRPAVADLGAGRVSLWFAKVRELGMRRSGGCGVLFTGGSTAEIVRVLKSGSSVVGMLDLPARDNHGSVQLSLLGREIRIPTGLAELAIAQDVPVILFSGGLNPDSGLRELRIEQLPHNADLVEIMTSYARHLDERLADESAYWQLWALAPLMFKTG